MKQNKKFCLRIAYFPLLLHGQYRKRRHQQFFTVSGTFLPSRCLANDRTDTHTDTQTDGEVFIKYTIEMGSGAMIYVPNFVNIGSGIQKLVRRIYSMVIA
jgi:hypothetical protein